MNHKITTIFSVQNAITNAQHAKTTVRTVHSAREVIEILNLLSVHVSRVITTMDLCQIVKNVAKNAFLATTQP